jgi:hypothetical protein
LTTNPAERRFPVLRLLAFVFVLAAVLTSLASGAAQAQSLTLSPAVVPLRGSFGQSATHVLTIHNDGTRDLAFALEARDVITRDGQRTFVTAGELPDSIAATAVFSPSQVQVPAGQSRTVQVTLTVPKAVQHRAMVALFRAATEIDRTGRKAHLSLGTLFTFTLSERASLAVDLKAQPPTGATNARIETALVNDGSEPVEPRGMAVILDAQGAIVGKTAMPSHRLLPGERGTLSAEYPGELARGTYRALVTLDFSGRTLTRTTEMVVQ